MQNERAQLLKKALDVLGSELQMGLAIEEMAELTKAICKWRRRPNEPERVSNMLEEIADVQIMLDQLRVMFGETDDWERAKLKRLEELIASRAAW